MPLRTVSQHNVLCMPLVYSSMPVNGQCSAADAEWRTGDLLKKWRGGEERPNGIRTSACFVEVVLSTSPLVTSWLCPYNFWAWYILPLHRRMRGVHLHPCQYHYIIIIIEIILIIIVITESSPSFPQYKAPNLVSDHTKHMCGLQAAWMLTGFLPKERAVFPFTCGIIY
jgi:hypothetical protein